MAAASFVREVQRVCECPARVREPRVDAAVELLNLLHDHGVKTLGGIAVFGSSRGRPPGGTVQEICFVEQSQKVPAGRVTRKGYSYGQEIIEESAKADTRCSNSNAYCLTRRRTGGTRNVPLFPTSQLKKKRKSEYVRSTGSRRTAISRASG